MAINGQHPAQHTQSLREQLQQRSATIQQQCLSLPHHAGTRLVFAAATSLEIQCVPTLRSHGDTTLRLLEAVSLPSQPRARGTGIKEHRWHIGSPASVIAHHNGLHTLDPIHSWAQLATQRTLEELIIIGDAIATTLAGGNAPLSRELAQRLHATQARLQASQPQQRIPAQTTIIETIRRFADRQERYHGKKACITAAQYIACGSMSMQETRVRLALVQHGLPLPECNHEISHLAFNSGMPFTLDLAWPAARVGIEYDGDHHRTDRRQWRNDHAKRNRLQQHGWHIFTIDADTINTVDARAHFALNVARILDQRGVTTAFRPVAQPL
ncbi:hypothetical protein [Bifidobacterium thermophilum]|uniref:endonuclease domain-containing protein n=1 Tax=Bifidobacterium thermophilum TaxID=33905 RepID=UPI0030A2FA60